MDTGIYNYTYNTTGNINYTTDSTSNLLIISTLTESQDEELTALYNCLIKGIGCARDKYVYGIEYE